MQYDLVCLSETWFDKPFYVGGFAVKHSGNTNVNRGGAALLIGNY